MSEKPTKLFATEPVEWEKLAEFNRGPWHDLATGEPLPDSKGTGIEWTLTVVDGSSHNTEPKEPAAR